MMRGGITDVAKPNVGPDWYVETHAVFELIKLVTSAFSSNCRFFANLKIFERRRLISLRIGPRESPNGSILSVTLV